MDEDVTNSHEEITQGTIHRESRLRLKLAASKQQNSSSQNTLSQNTTNQNTTNQNTTNQPSARQDKRPEVDVSWQPYMPRTKHTETPF